MNDRQCSFGNFELFGGVIAGQQIGQRCPQIAAVTSIERADDPLGDPLDIIIDV